MILLSICIPTIVTREQQFNKLYSEIERQIKAGGYENKVQLIFECDNKEISIGAKRQLLLNRSEGLYNVQIDDDDWIAEDYIETIIQRIVFDNTVYDCIGYYEKCVFENRVEYSSLSIESKSWRTLNPAQFTRYGSPKINHLRTPFCKTPILTSICKKVGYSDMRFGEDHDFAKRVYPFLESELFIIKEMYIYQYKQEEHFKKYGIVR